MPHGAPTLLASHQLLDGDVTALVWGGDSPSAPAAVPVGVLLAVGGRSGSVKLLRVQLDGSAEVLAEASDHKAAVSGLAFVQSGTAGDVGLVSTDREGRRVLYGWSAAKGQLNVASTAIVPRGSFVGLEAAQGGAALLAASRGGRATVWEAGTGSERRTVQLLGSSHGGCRCSSERCIA